jgi:hypothetical protein
MKIAIIGGGIFGSLASIKIASKFPSVAVHLYESSPDLLKLASRVNQARLHTGMHYPRDFNTAASAYADYEKFYSEFGDALKPIEQYYGIASKDTLTTPDDFLRLASLIKLPYKEVNPNLFFKDKKVDLLIQVPESTIETDVLRKIIKQKIYENKNISVFYSSEILQIRNEREITFNDEIHNYDNIISTTYASSIKFGEMLNIKLPKFHYQLCEVLFGESKKLNNIGITLMDGKFWSTMPFGFSNLHTLTSVLYTPVLENSGGGLLVCQNKHSKCGKGVTEDCNDCIFRPKSINELIINDYSKYIKEKYFFKYKYSEFVLKTVLSSTKGTTEGRPSQIFSNDSNNNHIIFSGKIGSVVTTIEDLLARIEV